MAMPKITRAKRQVQKTRRGRMMRAGTPPMNDWLHHGWLGVLLFCQRRGVSVGPADAAT